MTSLCAFFCYSKLDSQIMDRKNWMHVARTKSCISSQIWHSLYDENWAVFIMYESATMPNLFSWTDSQFQSLPQWKETIKYDYEGYFIDEQISYLVWVNSEIIFFEQQ